MAQSIRSIGLACAVDIKSTGLRTRSSITDHCGLIPSSSCSQQHRRASMGSWQGNEGLQAIIASTLCTACTTVKPPFTRPESASMPLSSGTIWPDVSSKTHGWSCGCHVQLIAPCACSQNCNLCHFWGGLCIDVRGGVIAGLAFACAGQRLSQLNRICLSLCIHAGGILVLVIVLITISWSHMV